MAMQDRITAGPVELRVIWEHDTVPYEIGDAEDPDEARRYVEMFGVLGCSVEIRKPACGCCGAKSWEHGASLWSIVGDADYHALIERELIAEAMS